MGVECHLNPHAKHGNFSDCTATTPEARAAMILESTATAQAGLLIAQAKTVSVQVRKPKRPLVRLVLACY